MSLKPSLPIIVLLLIVAGCGLPHTVICLPGEHPVVTESLYFGTAKAEGIVTEDDWASFIDTTVMPAFPDGLTSWAASGRWRMATGMVEHEISYVLQLTHDGSREKDTAIQHIMRTFKNDFQQEAVMRIRSQACRSF